MEEKLIDKELKDIEDQIIKGLNIPKLAIDSNYKGASVSMKVFEKAFPIVDYQPEENGRK